MPANRKSRSRFVRALAVRAVVACALLAVAAVSAPGQPAPPKPADTLAAVKLPDGTVVFFTKNPDDPNPPIDGVLLSAQEYKELQEKADQLKKLKAAPKSAAPSECHLRGKIEPRGDRLVATLTATYRFRTAAANTPVTLGMQRAFPLSATLDGKLPLLSSDDGLTALVEAAGEHTLVLKLEAPVSPRGAKGEVGFDLGLPRAAITTVALDPIDKVKRVTVGVRTPTDRPNELRRTVEEMTRLQRPADQPGFPLVSPAEQLDLTWEPPTAQPMATDTATDATADVRVTVDETTVETIVKLRLKGSVKEWSLILPATADVSAERGTPATTDPLTPPIEVPLVSPSTPSFTRPTDPKNPVWTFRPPDNGGTEWTVTASIRQTRPKATDPKYRGPYPVGPVAVPTAARFTGTIVVSSPATIGLGFQPGPDVRRQDATATDGDLTARFTFATTRTPASKPQPTPLLDLDARTIPGVLRVQPDHVLEWRDGAWLLKTDVKITPVRMKADQLAVEVPAGWEAFAALNTDLVQSTDEPAKDAAPNRVYILRLREQKDPFALTLRMTMQNVIGPDATLSLPRFVGAVEQGSKLTVTVPAGYEIRGAATGWDGRAVTGSQELTPAVETPASVVPTSLVGRFDQGIAKVALSWAPHRPELLADLQADVTLQDRQILVEQTIRFSGPAGDPRVVRLLGSPELRGLESRPALQATGTSDWTYRLDGSGKEATLFVSFAIPYPASGRAAIAMLWPETATRVESRVRVWAGGNRRLSTVSGPWRDLPPETSDGRDTLPLRVLSGSGNRLPLTIELTDGSEGALPTTTVERVLAQAWLTSDGGVATRARFCLTRWSSSGVVVELPVGASADLTIDGLKIDAAPVPDLPNAVRVMLPEMAANRFDTALAAAGGTAARPMTTTRFVLLDVVCVLPSLRSSYGTATLTPPRVLRAVQRVPTRWQILTPPDMLLVTTQGDLHASTRWAWHRGLLQPTTGVSGADLDHWLTTGIDRDFGGGLLSAAPAEDALTVRQSTLGPVSVVRVPRSGMILGCSLLVIVVGLALSSVRVRLLGPILAILGIGLSVVATLWPQPTAVAVAAALPGIVILVGILTAFGALRWLYRRRVTHLPGFVRTLPPSSAPAPPLPASTTSQPLQAPSPSGTGSRRSSRPTAPTSGR